MEIKVTITKRTKEYKDKETGATRTMKLVVLTLPNKAELEISSNRFNYRAFDYLTELCDKGGE
jgi:hypothetical protein